METALFLCAGNLFRWKMDSEYSIEGDTVDKSRGNADEVSLSDSTYLLLLCSKPV
jgi:hypothetical protein